MVPAPARSRWPRAVSAVPSLGTAISIPYSPKRVPVLIRSELSPRMITYGTNSGLLKRKRY
jgi:hypothetical protein